MITSELTLKSEQRAMNFVVQVDRSNVPAYPPWKKRLLHPELETAGFPVYYLSMLRAWLYKKQETGLVRGQEIYDFLKDKRMISTCLNLQDGIAIARNPVEVVHDVFGDQALVLWASAAESNNRQFSVPYLHVRHYGERKELAIAWRWLDDFFSKFYPALRYNNIQPM